jgi:putative membrane protein
MNAALAALPLLTHEARGDCGHPWWPLRLIFWAGLIGTAVWLISRRRDRGGEPLDRARELLAERYARGELSGEEYRERLDELNRSVQGARSNG